ncbi:ankyrin repeat domain-containing protein [Marinobacter salsuginis]
MATFPSIETVLMEIHQSLGLKQGQTKTKRKFSTGNMRLAEHQAMGERILSEIFDELELDGQARADFMTNLTELGNAFKGLECNTWTFQADERQVLWVLLGYFFTPGIARHTAFWNLHGNLDRGMPRGSFWYLPEPRTTPDGTKIDLPVKQVIDWLADLAGGSIESLSETRIRVKTDRGQDDADTFTRTLYNWRSGTLPFHDKIYQFFPDDLDIPFEGTIEIDTAQPAAHQFDAAVAFLKNRELDVNEDALRRELAMGNDHDVKRIIAGQATKSEKELLVRLVADRYQKPTTKIIRQRLLFARLMQDGYDRILKKLCPGVDKLCSNFEQNKLLQILASYKHIYNLTVEAWRNFRSSGEAAENAWFEEQLEPGDANTLYLSILPSRRKTGNLELAQLLTQLFSLSRPGDELTDIVSSDAPTHAQIVRSRVELLRNQAEEGEAARDLIERARTASPWRTFQKENRFAVMAQVANFAGLSPKARWAATSRMKELAETPEQKIQPILLELGNYLGVQGKKRLPNDACTRVESLLNEAKQNSAYANWRALLLHFEAKHQLAMNDINNASKSFRQALEASDEKAYGTLKGEIALDCLATEVANQRLVPNNHERYYRAMLGWGVFNNRQVLDIYDSAREAADYFWHELYTPYPGIEPMKPVSEQALKDSFGLIMSGDLPELENWIKDNSRKFSHSLKCVTGDSVLMLWIKLRSHFNDQLPKLRHIAPAEFESELQRVETITTTWRQAIKLFASKVEKQLNYADFKGQTPLMLVAEAGDAELVRCFLDAGANPDLQDFEGRSALHAAVKSHDKETIDALLDHPCTTDLSTVDGRSPMHTGAWSGNGYAIDRLIELSPELAWRRDSHDMTPLELAEKLCEEPDALAYLNQELEKQKRKPVYAKDLQGLISSLENAPMIN